VKPLVITALGAGCLLSLLAAGQGCGPSKSSTGATGGSSSHTSTGTAGTGAGVGTGGVDAGPKVPAPPKLGTQVDRMGRPAINTALNHTFDPDAAARTGAKDAWNGDANDSTWAATYTAEVEKNLAIFDALDGACGNQALADTTKTDATRYATLGAALADDRLWLDTSASVCSVYLAVEANATKLMTNTDCGGRQLGYDVIDQTFSLLAVGAPSGVTDGVPAKTSSATLPYLAAPN
jgi:hypothetical protein